MSAKKFKRGRAENTLQSDLTLGLEYQRSGRFNDAAKCYSRALKQQADNAKLRTNMGAVLREAGRHVEAIKQLKKALILEPTLLQAYLNLALSQLEVGAAQDALETYRRALLFHPNSLDSRLGEGHVLRDMGCEQEAIAAFLQALKLDPDNAQAHYFLAQMRDHSLPDEHDTEYGALKISYGKSLQGSPSRRDLAWGLGRALEQRGDYELAFSHIQEAHQITGGSQEFDLQATQDYFTQICSATHSAVSKAHSDGGSNNSQVPIFVLGLPRSGTTLVEQILASNPQVYGAGEQRLMGSLCARLELASGKSFAEAFAGLADKTIGSLADAYIQKLSALAPTAKRIVDKMPANFLCAGIICLMFPEAKIIHCRREAMAVCWSIYSTRFAEPHHFANQLTDLGGYYRLYREMMQYWEGLFPGRIYTVDYECLVEQPDVQIKALIEHCNLDFSDHYLQFYNTQRTIRTASVNQVRRPIYQSAVTRYAPFEPYLQPLRTALGDSL